MKHIIAVFLSLAFCYQAFCQQDTSSNQIIIKSKFFNISTYKGHKVHGIKGLYDIINPVNPDLGKDINKVKTLNITSILLMIPSGFFLGYLYNPPFVYQDKINPIPFYLSCAGVVASFSISFAADHKKWVTINNYNNQINNR